MTNIVDTKLEATKIGFWVRTATSEEFLEWDMMREIVGYRQNPGGEDLLCLAFRISALNEFTEIHEEMSGYSEVIAAMYEAFPKINRTWWQEVMRTFGTNRTTLHGMPAARQLSRNEPPGSSAKFLLKGAHTNSLKKKRFWLGILNGILILSILASLQVLLSWGLSTVNDFLAAGLGLLIFALGLGRTLPEPKRFFPFLLGFLLAEWLIAPQSIPTTLGKLFSGHLEYLLLLGAVTLLGMSIMLLPDKRYR